MLKDSGDSYKVSSCFNHSTSLALLQQLEQLHWVDVANCGCAGWKIHPFSGSKVKDGELGSLKFATLYCKGFWTGLSSATTKMPELLEAWTSFLQTLLKWQKNPFAAVAGSALGDQHDAKCITCLLVMLSGQDNGGLPGGFNSLLVVGRTRSWQFPRTDSNVEIATIRSLLKIKLQRIHEFFWEFWTTCGGLTWYLHVFILIMYLLRTK